MKSSYSNFKDYAADKIQELMLNNNKLTLEELKNSFEFKNQVNLFELWKNYCTELFFKKYPKKKLNTPLYLNEVRNKRL